MATTYFFEGRHALQEVRVGALAPYVDGFAEWLWERGYSKSAGRAHIRLVAEFGRWVDKRGLGVGDIDESRVAKFVRLRRGRPRLHRGHRATLRLVLEYLRGVRAVAVPAMVVGEGRSPLENEFRAHLLDERGLSPLTVGRYLAELRLFLRERFRRGPIVPSLIQAMEINRFVSRRSQCISPRTVKATVTALRAFARFLRLRGDVTTDLAGAVLTGPNWRLATLPKWIPADQLEQIFKQCDQSTALGQRNYTILLLLARLGLRAGEVVSMTLDDVDWEAGELTVRGKGLRQERLPLPTEVGKAMACYLRRWRPRCSTRRLFVRAKAPLRGFASPAAISTIVARAIRRAGLDLPSTGAHMLRFTLATDILRRGGSLAEVGELLRHRHPDTTALYARVDFQALRVVAPAWPGARV
jgi:site-specific recombinase XerD